LGRRPDGYHDLDTVAVFAEIGDRLWFEEGDRPGVELVVEGPFAGAVAEVGAEGASNLAVAAAKAFFEAAGMEVPSLRLILDKQLPVAAGIGGGSADAAACLRLLMRRFPGRLSAAALEAVALRLGSDVPMCLRSEPLRATGRGERVDAIAGLPALPLVLLNPGVGVATRNVFAVLDRMSGTALPPLPDMRRAPNLVAWLLSAGNDLEAPAQSIAPSIRVALRALESVAGCLFARMSGSGPTSFGLFASEREAARAAREIQKTQPDWWVIATRSGGSGS
jgi:4-diphosphocytidyl-2-C-methyl-D-erythritol kinase